MIQKIWKPIQRFGRWLFGAPFRELPQEFGDLTPPELRIFEAEAEEVRQRPQTNSPTPSPLPSQRR